MGARPGHFGRRVEFDPGAGVVSPENIEMRMRRAYLSADWTAGLDRQETLRRADTWLGSLAAVDAVARQNEPCAVRRAWNPWLPLRQLAAVVLLLWVGAVVYGHGTDHAAAVCTGTLLAFVAWQVRGGAR